MSLSFVVELNVGKVCTAWEIERIIHSLTPSVMKWKTIPYSQPLMMSSVWYSSAASTTNWSCVWTTWSLSPGVRVTGFWWTISSWKCTTCTFQTVGTSENPHSASSFCWSDPWPSWHSCCLICVCFWPPKTQRCLDLWDSDEAVRKVVGSYSSWNHRRGINKVT